MLHQALTGDNYLLGVDDVHVFITIDTKGPTNETRVVKNKVEM